MELPINVLCNIIRMCNLNTLLGNKVLDQFIIYNKLFPKSNILTVCVYHSLVDTLKVLLNVMTPCEVFQNHHNFNNLIRAIVKNGNLCIMQIIMEHCKEHIFALDGKINTLCKTLLDDLHHLHTYKQLKHKDNIIEFYNIYIRLFTKHNKHDIIPWHYLAESYMLLKNKTTCIRLLDDGLLDDFLTRYHHILLRFKIHKTHERLFETLVRLKIPIPRDMVVYNLPLLKSNTTLLLQVLKLVDGQLYHNTCIDIFKHAIMHHDWELMHVIGDNSDVSIVKKSIELIISNDNPIVWDYTSKRLNGYVLQFCDIYSSKYGYKNPIAKHIVKFLKNNVVQVKFHLIDMLELAVDANDRIFFLNLVKNNSKNLKPDDYHILKIFAQSIERHWDEFDF